MTTIDASATILHWACAALYIFVGVLALVRGPRSSPAWWLGVACGATSLWSASLALQWPTVSIGPSLWLELARSCVWYGLVLSLFRRSAPMTTPHGGTLMVVGLTLAVSTMCMLLMDLLSIGHQLPLTALQISLLLTAPICNLVLLENFYFNTPAEDRWSIQLLCIALAMQFTFDIILHADSVMFRRYSFVLYEGRIVVVIIAAPLIALATARNRGWGISLHISRVIAFRGASLIIAGSVLLALGSVGEVIRKSTADWGHVIESAIVIGGMTSVVLLLTSGAFRARVRHMVSEHFFSYRYDYRREWVRCVDTLTAPDAHANLHLRAIRAAAAVVDSPAGILFVRAPEDVAFRWAASWNYPTGTEAIPPNDQLVGALENCSQTIVLGENGVVPGRWIEILPRTWIAVPLRSFGRIVGFVLLARSRSHFKLDNETFELLRVVGSEIGSRIAEHRAAQLVIRTNQLREYSQRFAFVAHDIKSVSGQLKMLLANAEFHAGDQAFQRSIITTIEESVSKISGLLSRLQTLSSRRDHTISSPVDIVLSLIGHFQVKHRARVVFRSYYAPISVAVSLDIIDAIFRHLITNALEVSGSDEYVFVSVHADDIHLAINVADQGSGMTAEFVRDDLFTPFVSTKYSGLGIGAYQAQELARVVGGDVLIRSQVAAGTVVRVLLPIV